MKTLLGKFFLALFLSLGAAQAHAYNWFVSCTGFAAGVPYEDENKIPINSPVEPTQTTFSGADWQANLNDLDSRAAPTCRRQVVAFARTLCPSLTAGTSISYRVGTEMQGFTGFNYDSYYYWVPMAQEKTIPVADVCPICRNQGYSWTYQTSPGNSVDPNVGLKCGYQINGQACPASAVPLSPWSYPQLRYTCH
jgi:hypothetical protein